MNEPLPIDIGNVCDGAMVEAFNLKLAEVLNNIYDLTTPATKARSITLTLALKPREDRVQIDCEFSCNAKLASIEPKTSRLFVGRDMEGNLYALTSDPRQQNLFTPPAPAPVKEPIVFNAGK